MKRKRRWLVFKVEHVVRLPFVWLDDTDHHGVLNHVSFHEFMDAAAEKDACSKGGVAAQFLFLAPLRGWQVFDVDERSGGLDFAFLVDGIEDGSIHTGWRLEGERVLLIKDFFGGAPYDLVHGHLGVTGLTSPMLITVINFFTRKKGFCYLFSFLLFLLVSFFLLFLWVSSFYCLVGFTRPRAQAPRPPCQWSWSRGRTCPPSRRSRHRPCGATCCPRSREGTACP